MITEILLVRHGETEWNAKGKFQGCIDISLSKEGIMQAQFLKSRFQNGFDGIYASPLKRAMETANIICEGSSLQPTTANDLREINFGEWEGLTINEISTNYAEQFKSWRTDENDAYLIGGDISLKKASIRAKKAILEIAEKCQGKKIIIIAHGGIIKAGLIGIFDWKMTMYHKMILGNTSVSSLTFDNFLYPKLITLNDTSHLPVNYKPRSYV